jgi:fibronectin-binding autotransporter adhesin
MGMQPCRTSGISYMGNNGFAAGRVPRSGRSMQRFRFGTCLTTTAAALLVGAAPASAAPAPLLTLNAVTLPAPIVPNVIAPSLPVDLTVRRDLAPAPRLAPSTATSISVSGNATFVAHTAPAPLHDLTTVPSTRLAMIVSGVDVSVDAGNVTTSGDYDHGVATFATGTTTITAGDIATSGTRAAGVHAVGSGDITIAAGNIATSGYRAEGIYASTNLGGTSGGITITADTVTTTGFASSGINAAAYHGATSIDVGTVKTSGYGSDGINAWSYEQNATIKAGTVATTGDAGRGIVAYSGGTTTVLAGTVTTSGAGTGRDSDAGGIIAVGAAVNVQAGTVSTKGDTSAGIYAISNRVHDNGQDFRDITVSAGSVTTSGAQSDGIDALNYSMSKTSVTAGHVATSGDASWGIYAAGLGDASVKAGTIDTKGANAAGIVVTSLNGNIDVSADTVATHGDHSNGINAVNYSQYGATTIKVGALSTDGAGSAGIYVGGSSAYQGASHVVTIDAGSITTKGDLAAGLVVLTGGTVNAAVGDVTMEGPRARGIIITTNEGDINLTAGNVVTKGAVALGRDASGIALSDNYGNITADIQSISTAGDHSSGIITNGLYSNQSFVVHDGITTTGAHSAGVFANLTGGSLSIDTNAIATSGAGSNGVTAYVSNGDVGIHVGDLTTLGDNSNGLNIQSSSYGGAHLISVAVDTVTTKGAYASGVLATAQGGNIDIGGGSITTSGAHSAGIAAAAGNGVDADGNVYGGNVTIDVGSIATSGNGSNGIDTVATQSTNVTVGNVTTSGASSDGIHAYGNGPMTIDVGSVATKGDHSYAIYALTASGDVSVKAGSVDSGGFLGHGIRAASYSGNVTVDAGSVTGSVGTAVDVRAGYGNHGNATVTAGTIVTDGAGIVALAGNDVTIHAGSVTTHSGIEDAGTQLGQAIKAIGHGNVDITAGTLTTTGYWAEGISAVASPSFDTGQEPGNITIDVGSVSTAGAKSTGIYAIDTGYQNGGSQTVSIKAGPVSTLGDAASGIYGVGPNVTIAANGPVSTGGNAATGVYAAAIGGNAIITAGDVSTKGDFSSGVRAFSADGRVDITTTGAISTTGANSYGVLAFGSADLTIHNSGSVTTAGTFARGLYAISSTGLATITNSGTLSTSGDFAEGIRAISFATGVNVTSTGSIATTGDYSAGIIAGRDRSGRGDKAVTVTDDAIPTVSVSATNVTTSGLHSNGVIAVNYAFGGTTSVTVDRISTTGANSAGVAAVTFGDLAINAGEIHSAGTAIYARTNGAYQQSITVTGAAVSTGDTAIVAGVSFGNTVVNVGKGANVSGGGHRDPVYGGGNGILIDVYQGTGTINNAGTISTAGGGYAIEATPGLDYYGHAGSRITINNSGKIIGAVKLSAGTDVLNNSGVFVATRDSDFGGGGDSFVNSGTLFVAPGTKPGTIAFNNLATFTNASGLIDFRNGVAGDVLRLSGSFVGSGASLLALDLIGGKADQLEVAGATTGHTAITLAVSGADVRLLAAPVTLVKAGAGSAADAFSITNGDIGLLHYGIRYDATAAAYGLTTAAGAPVYRTLNIPRAAQATWLRAEDAWDAHMSEKRDASRAPGGNFGQRLWGQMYAGITTQDGSRTLDGNRVETGYRQDYYGGQVGLDLAGKKTDKGGTLFGVTGSYISSHLNSRASADRSQFDTIELGAYASFLSGPLFANFLGQYGHDWIGSRNITLGYKDHLKGDSYGAALQLGAHFGSDRIYAEPTMSLSYVSTDISDLRALGQTIDFDKRDGLRGKFGGRLGSALDMKGGGKAVVYINGAYVHEFEGKAGLDFLSGGVGQHVSGIAPNDYGHAALGVNFLSAGRASGFIEGDADFGGGTSGGGARVGLSFKL